ncbi:MAG: tryptophan-rich sensory protein [Oculatellaceae cyanobacterium Prado106]|jgi:tryptophan-rich sensory protein|nr:tryptophan-rich sensory protein [Oculatellaceae cyanobacterium Prado106]
MSLLNRPALLNRPNLLGLISNMLFFAVLAAVINAITLALGWGAGNDPAELQPTWAPPGWAIGGVWLILLAALGAARWLAIVQSRRGAPSRAGWVTGLAVFCCLYPFWTLAFNSRTLSLIGNVLTLILAGWVTWKMRRVSAGAMAIGALVLAWVVFATGLVVRLIQLNGWN